MIEGVLILDAILNDGTIGLAAQLATVPKEGADSTPPTPTIYNEAEDSDAALDVFPDGDGPYLLISTRTSNDGNPVTRPVQDVKQDVVFRYAIRRKNTQDAIRIASYTMRALKKSLAKAFSTSTGTALRVRNQVGLFHLQAAQEGQFTAPTNDTPVSWALTCTVSLRDTWANS